MASLYVRWLKWIVVIFLLIGIVAIIAGLSAVNYGNGMAFVVGIPLTLFVAILVWLGGSLWRKGHKTLVILLGGLLFLAINITLTLLFTYPYAPVIDTLKSRILAFSRGDSRTMAYYVQPKSAGVDRAAVQVTEYRLSITPTDQTLTRFQISGKLRLVEDGKEHLLTFTQNDLIKSVSSSQGWLLREVTLTLPERILPQFSWKDGDITRESQEICCFRPIGVSVQTFPKGAFYEAKDAADLKTTAYGKFETIEWTIHDPWGESQQLQFSFLPSPYHQFPFLHRFAVLSSIADWVLTVCGMLGSSLLIAMIVPVLKDIGKKKVEGTVKRFLKKEPNSLEAEQPQEISEEGVEHLARHLAQRLPHEQVVKLRKEIDTLLSRYSQEASQDKKE